MSRNVSSVEASDSVRRRLIKLLALARRGEGGEKENAQRMLAKLLARHGLTVADIERPERTPRRFAPRGDVDERLLLQVVYRVLNTADFKLYRNGRKGRARLIHLTDVEHAEVQFLWNLYRRQWNKELDLLFSAFIHKHSLFGAPSPSKNVSQKPLSPADSERLRTMMNSLERVREHKPLEHAK